MALVFYPAKVAGFLDPLVFLTGSRQVEAVVKRPQVQRI